MNIKKVVIIISALFISSFLITSLSYTQGGGTAEKKEVINEAEAPDDSYLAKFHATDLVNKYMERNLNSLYMLKVIVTNFSGKNWKGEYDKIYNGYKNAMSLYYKRQIIKSRVSFEKNDQEIKELMKKIITDYQSEATKMLDECAEKVLALHLDATTRSDPNRNEALFLNQMRLKIAYSQFDDASTAKIKHYYKGSIFHLRVAKAYAIKILEGLAPPDQKQSVSQKYYPHKADNLNRILGASKQQK